MSGSLQLKGFGIGAFGLHGKEGSGLLFLKVRGSGFLGLRVIPTSFSEGSPGPKIPNFLAPTFAGGALLATAVQIFGDVVGIPWPGPRLSILEFRL